MVDENLNLFDFGTNKNGEYVNLVEEEKRAKDISREELEKWVESNYEPLTKIVFHLCVGYIELGRKTNNEIKEMINKIVDTKCYHYGNMKKDLYIFSLTDGCRQFLVFYNLKHYLVAYINDDTLENYFMGRADIVFPASYCPIFDEKGNRIEQYADGENYKKDIRHIVIMDEWQAKSYSRNRINEGKNIKDFYECEFTLPDLIKYWGESTLENEDE